MYNPDQIKGAEDGVKVTTDPFEADPIVEAALRRSLKTAEANLERYVARRDAHLPAAVGQVHGGRIYPVAIKARSGITRWGGWPEDVEPRLRSWNQGRNGLNSALNFWSVSIFKCSDCLQFCEQPMTAQLKRFGDRDKDAAPICDECLVARALRANERAAVIEYDDVEHGSCICRMRKLLDFRDPACPYHRAADDFPANHRIAWNCMTYWDGCNCTDPNYCTAAFDEKWWARHRERTHGD